MTEDLATVFHGSMTNVVVVETLLRDAGILTHVEVADANPKHLMSVGPSGDSFEFQIQVPKSQAERARTMINERKVPEKGTSNPTYAAKTTRRLLLCLFALATIAIGLLLALGISSRF